MKQRIVTGLILSGIFIICLFSGYSVFLLVLSLIGVLTLREMIQMCKISTRSFYVRSLLIGNACLFSGLIFEHVREKWESQLFIGVTITLLSIGCFEVMKKKAYFIQYKLGIILRALFIINFSLPYLAIIFTKPSGHLLVLWLIAVIGASDIFALMIGRKWGHKKLSVLSPNKTIEGCLGGILMGTIIGITVAEICHFDVIKFGILGPCIALSSQIGDLHESLLKRTFNIKDSSRLLPGHGGLYDRFDGYIFAIPTFYILHTFWIFL